MNRKFMLGTSFVLWLISLALPALISSKTAVSFGWAVLAFGWLGFAGIEDNVNLLGVLAWWANPLYLWAMAKFTFGSKLPSISSYLAVGVGTLTMLLGSYAVNAVPSFTPIIGYGPGAVLWFLALLGPAYLVAKDSGHVLAAGLVMLGVLLVCVYIVQLGWRTISANDSELDRLPFYSAKRGFICSAKASPLPILEKQPAILVDSSLSKYWFEWLRNTGVNAIQWESNQYKRAPNGSPESLEPPYMIVERILKPARYKLLIEGDYPFRTRWPVGSGYVRMHLIDNFNGRVVGVLEHKRETNRKLGFCPSLTYSQHSPTQEVIKWLSPFISEEESKQGT